MTAPRRVLVRVGSSKLAYGALVVRGPHGYLRRFSLTLERHGSALRFPVRRAGSYRLDLTGTAVNGRPGAARVLVQVKPDPAIKRRREARRRAARRRIARQEAERRERADRARE